MNAAGFAESTTGHHVPSVEESRGESVLTINDVKDAWAVLNADSRILKRLTESVEKEVPVLMEVIEPLGAGRSVAACLHLGPIRLTSEVCSTLATFWSVISGAVSYVDVGDEEIILGTKASLLRLSLRTHSSLENVNTAYVLLSGDPDWPRRDLGTGGTPEALKKIPSRAKLFEKLSSERAADHGFANEQRLQSSDSGVESASLDMFIWSVLTDILTVHKRMLTMLLSVLDLQQQVLLPPTSPSVNVQTSGQSGSFPHDGFMTCVSQLASASFVLHRFASAELFGEYP